VRRSGGPEGTPSAGAKSFGKTQGRFFVPAKVTKTISVMRQDFENGSCWSVEVWKVFLVEGAQLFPLTTL